jgi:hypothetical protein
MRAILAATTLALISTSSVADDIHINCLNDKRFYKCENDQITTCGPYSEAPAELRFTIDLKKKTGSLLFCTNECLDPYPLVVLHDYSEFLHDYGKVSLSFGVTVWEHSMEQTFTITNTRYISSINSIWGGADRSVAFVEFGRCILQ